MSDEIEQIDTPAVLVDLDLVDKNITAMFEALSGSHVTVRPHLKTVKNPFFARMLLERGAAGVCVAKLGEAQVMADAGIEDILITTEIVGAAKVAALMQLLKRHPDVKIVVDSRAGADQIDQAARDVGLTTPIKTLVELNVGQNRCGVEPGEPALALVQHLTKSSHLLYSGVQGYEGHLQMLPDAGERRRECLECMDRLLITVNLLKSQFLPPKIVSTGGTGTAEICATIPEVTEVQPGSFVFWDTAYRKAVGSKYANALSVVATVISKSGRYRAVVDAGTKSLSTDSGNAELKHHPDLIYRPGGDEHGIIESNHGPLPFEIGDRLELLPSHIDTTVNLHDFYNCHRGRGQLEKHAISARGKVQ